MTEEDTYYRLQGRKNLYFLKRMEHPHAWSVCYVEAIVTAWNESEARMIHPSGKLTYVPGDPEWFTTWVSPAKVEVYKIGLAELDAENVIMHRWNNT